MKKLLATGIFIASSIFMLGQEVRCYSTELHEIKYFSDANYQKNFNESQKRLNSVLSQLKDKKIMLAPPYTVPVVVHVVHNNGAENISDAQIQSQISVLNEDFRRITSSRGEGAGVDTQIEFCLATLDPSGNPTTGINRVVSSTYTDLNINTEDGGLKSLIHWDENSYLNIYVVQRICTGSGTGCGILGYAYFTNAGAIDGVVCGYNYFGTADLDDGSFVLSAPYNLGRTMTHEVGHWVNLYHTFQGGCTNNDCDVDGDRVCDTPPVNPENYGCPTGTNSCSTDDNDLSFSFPDRDDYIDNYMDYTDDACMSRYTQGQADRSIAALISNNPNIFSNANLTATGCQSTLEANFISFDGIQNNNKILLNWLIPEALNFDDFQIEKSENGLTFYTIGVTKKYDFIDFTPLKGVNYYRIKVVKNNRTEYSKIIKVIFEPIKTSVAFPNPFKNEISLKITKNEKGNVKIYDVFGKLIIDIELVETNSDFMNIDTQHLPKGIYYLEISSMHSNDFIKVVKE